MKNILVKALSAVMSMVLVLGICSCGKKSSKVSVKPGDTVTLGTYAGKKIEWIVLDTGDNGALIITKEGLDAKQMDDETGTVENIWEDCDLRAWLNGEFYNESFTKDEQKKINKTKVGFEKSSAEYCFARDGEDTEDYVFLLSYKEAKKYFKSDESRMCPLTSLARTNGGYEDYKNSCKWWLRTNAAYKNSYNFVNEKGEINPDKGAQCHAVDVCIRPVMWVNI